MNIRNTNFHLARNKDNSLCLFDTKPRKEFGTWFVYHNGERDYGYRLNYTDPICENITMDNSPYPVDVDIKI